jgi:hypothetical protein
VKIKPPKHTIIAASTINKDIDIPLAYIGQDSSDYTVTLSGFEQGSREIVMPYDKFASPDVTLFDKDGNIVANENVLHRINGTNEYYFMPENYRSFVPQKFEYWMTAKKNMAYRLDRIYDISVGCESYAMLEKLAAFGNSSMKPHNIYLNSNEMLPQKYLDGINHKDLTVISSPDGVHYGDGETVIDYSAYLDNHTNLWISCDKYGWRDFTASAPGTILFDSKTASYESATLLKEYIPNGFLSEIEECTVVNLGDNMPVVVASVQDKGFIVVSHSSLLDDAASNCQLFFDVASYVFRKAYVRSANYPAWAADSIPDYVIENGMAIHYDKIFYDINIEKLFSLSLGEAAITKIETNAENIIIGDMTSTKVAFAKSKSTAYSAYADPYFGVGGSTVYIPSGQVVYYSNFVYRIKSDLEQLASYIKNSETVILKIKPFKDSLAGINIKEQATITVDFPASASGAEHIVYALNNMVYSVKSDKYNGNGKQLFTVAIDRLYADNTVYDIRTKGGGSVAEDFNLLNIGNANGRPYRKAGSFVVTLPAKYKQYDAYVRAVIEQHSSASDLPIILYKEE